MNLLHHALGAARSKPVSRTEGVRARVAIVAGAGGALGSAVLEQALACGRFARVHALVTQVVAPGLRGFQALTLQALAAWPETRVGDEAPDTAFIVFDRQRHANGREAAFVHPQPHELPALARMLRGAGVRHLVVVLPHAPALLPQALRLGLASLDEQAVSALDFEHVVFVRSAQRAGVHGGSWLQRVAQAVLGQLALMVPQREQPVRAQRIAAFVVRLAGALPGTAAGTRVVPPELVWDAAQPDQTEDVVARWLSPPAPAAAGDQALGLQVEKPPSSG